MQMGCSVDADCLRRNVLLHRSFEERYTAWMRRPSRIGIGPIRNEVGQ